MHIQTFFAAEECKEKRDDSKEGPFCLICQAEGEQTGTSALQEERQPAGSVILQGSKETRCCWRGLHGTRGSQDLKNIAVGCPSCLVVNHLGSLLGDDGKPPDGKVCALDTLISLYMYDCGLARALQRTPPELPPCFELEAGGLAPQQPRVRSGTTRSSLLGHQPNSGHNNESLSKGNEQCKAAAGLFPGKARLLHLSSTIRQ